MCFRATENSAGRDMDLRDAIQRIALECLSYGRPRITAARAGRGGWSIPNGCTPPPTSEYQTNPIPKTNTTVSGSRQRRGSFPGVMAAARINPARRGETPRVSRLFSLALSPAGKE
jgi:hypothetical protein